MTDSVRVRMAPGPTGYFHIGRSRAAVLNWLFARHNGGTFVLRIEDTDRDRSREEYLESILDSLRWLGIDWNEGPETGGPYAPYFQMGRLDTYREYADRLLAAGHAYKCYCTAEELDEQRRRAESARRPFRYLGTCRALSAEQQAAHEAAGREAAVRLRVPDTGTTGWDDLILGPVSYENAEIGDFVIRRSNGIPLYNFTVTIDDLTMHITDVIRGQDHISNTPKQILIYEALGEPMPRFGHYPLITSAEGKKIGARFGATPVSGLALDGYLPEAVFNYIATLGVTYEGDREIFTREELVKRFSIGRVSRSPAVFDPDKLDWMNGVYIRNLPLDDFVRRSLPFLEARGLISSPPSENEVKYATAALRLEQERVKTLAETVEAVDFFLQEDITYDPALLVPRKGTLDDAIRVVDAATQIADSLPGWTAEELESAFRGMTQDLGLKTGVAFMTLRVAVTGRTFAPPLFDTMAVLGRGRVMRRLSGAQVALQSWHRAEETAVQ